VFGGQQKSYNAPERFSPLKIAWSGNTTKTANLKSVSGSGNPPEKLQANTAINKIAPT
jgi:hypothetical protein